MRVGLLHCNILAAHCLERTAAHRRVALRASQQRLPLKQTLHNLMLDATRLTRSGKLAEITAAIQRAVRGGTRTLRALVADPLAGPRRREVPSRFAEDTMPHARHAWQPQPVRTPAADTAIGPQFRAASFGNTAGERAYKLFVPSIRHPRPLPLVVMLHGCTQDPDDFATGTRMNELAEAQGFVVLYPEQPKSANGSRCWNWFNGGDQQRGRGEPSIIADMTRHVIATESVDLNRVFVAGLSAGGAMAATMARTYPELFAAVGVHSGLPHGAAHDVMSAFSAMRKGVDAKAAAPDDDAYAIPTIVFHGDNDTTVHPGNGHEVIEQVRAMPAHGAQAPAADTPVVERGRVPAGHEFTRTVYPDERGTSRAEHWLVHGAAHAWFGGDPQGSYIDPHGPDASQEMLRFFMQHPKRQA